MKAQIDREKRVKLDSKECNRVDIETRTGAYILKECPTSGGLIVHKLYGTDSRDIAITVDRWNPEQILVK